MRYTLELFKMDRRTKEGMRKIGEEEITAATFESAEAKSAAMFGPKVIVKVHQTYVTRVNIMSGKEYLERWDTPMCCSPSSESYWSM